MPTKLTITKEDLLKSKILEAGWYSAKVRGTTTKPAGTDGSTVYTVEMIVIGGPNQKDGGSPIGVPLYKTYSEKAPGFAVKFFQVLGAKIDPNKASTEVDFDGTKDRELKVFVKNDLWKGVMRNVVEDFEPLN